MALGIGAALNFLTRAVALNSLRRKKEDDGLGDQENRKKLAARAFLEGYEPDKRLFARGPVDDAPDVVVPEPLTEPVTNILPEQQRVIPQLVAPGVAGIAPGEEDTFILQEINRLDRNILAIAQSMEENAKIDAEYRASVIQQQKEQLAKRGQARSRRRSERRKGFFGSLKEQAEQKRDALANRFRNVRNELGKGFAGYSALLALAEAKKREDDIKEFFENVGNIPEEIKKLLEGNIASQDDVLGQADPVGQLNLPQSELQQKVLKRVYGPESQGSYNAMNQGTIKNAKGEDVIVGSTLDSKTILGQNLTDMTFGEVLKRQRFLMDPSNPQESDYGVFAAGAAQVAPNTLEGAMRRAGLTETDMFSPENQDKVTLQLIKERGIQPWTSGGSKYSDETKRMVEELRNLLNQPKSNPLGNQSFAFPDRGLFTPVSYSPSVAAMPMGEMSEVLEPFIVDQRRKEEEPVVTGVRGGSQEVPFLNPSTGPSLYGPLLGV